MSTTQLRGLLEDGISTARKTLQQKLDTELKEAKQKYLKTTDVVALIEKKNKIDQKIEELQEERETIEADIKVKDRSLTKKESDESGISTYYGKLSDYMAWKDTKGSKHQSNPEQFEYIARKFMQMFNMSIGIKEQRNVLGQFYKLDWNELGIEVPINAMTGEITIKDGKINVDRKQLSVGK